MPDANGEARSVRWQTYIAAAGLAILVLGSIVAFFVQLGSQSNDINTLKTQMSAQQNATANLPVVGAQLTNVLTRLSSSEAEVTTLRDRLNEILQQLATIKTSLREVETQFCANDMVRNQNHAFYLRIMSLLWEKVYRQPMPSNAYFPNVCGRVIQ